MASLATEGEQVTATSDVILQVRDLTKFYPIRSRGITRRHVGDLKAVNGVSFDLRRGETLGVVGESGCGKSSLARTILQLEAPTSGSAIYRGRDLFTFKGRELREARQRIQVVFQDPYSSLNPRMLIKDIVTEPWRVHGGLGISRARQLARAGELLERVGLNGDHLNRYPHQFSGGQRQRIGIARALALDPEILICDEPVSALDVSVQAQVINLLRSLQDELGLAMIFISHDLSVVRHIADQVAVMYLGEFVESGRAEDVYRSPTHPYTQALLGAVPEPDPFREKDAIPLLEGDLPSADDLPSGCFFRTRCRKAEELCENEHPELIDRFSHGHPSRCFFAAVER